MKTNLIPELIEGNLFGLYKAFAMAGDYPVMKHPFYTWIKTNKSIFPGNIFQIDTRMNEEALSELTALVKNDQAPPFLVFRDDNVPAAFIDRLKTKGFRQVMHWPGMALPLHRHFKWTADTDVNITVRKIEDEKEIKDWAGMVEEILFNGKKIDRNALVRLAGLSDCGLYTGFLDGLPAGTLLSWSDDQIAGLYMITTLPEFRKKGIAWHLTHTALSDAASVGCRYAMLESTPQGLSLYQRAGFKEYCSFSIYWMLGKNHQHE